MLDSSEQHGRRKSHYRRLYRQAERSVISPAINNHHKRLSMGGGNIKAGTRVIERKKKDAREGVVVEARGPKTWLVRFDNGDEDIRSSSQLQKHKQSATGRVTAAIRSILTPHRVRPQTQRISTPHQARPQQQSDGDLISPTGSLFENDSDNSEQASPRRGQRLFPDTSGDGESMEAIENFFDSDDDSIVPDPDIDEEEDETIPTDGFHAEARAIKDQDEARRVARKSNYVREKEKLIKDEHTIEKTVKPSSSIEVGTAVVTRAKDKDTGLRREGRVLRLVPTGDHHQTGKKLKGKWVVSIDGQEEEFKPQQLMRKNATEGKSVCILAHQSNFLIIIMKAKRHILGKLLTIISPIKSSESTRMLALLAEEQTDQGLICSIRILMQRQRSIPIRLLLFLSICGAEISLGRR